MTFVTAALWFIVSAHQIPHQAYTLGAVGPIATYEQCEVERKHMAKAFDGKWSSTFERRTYCMPVNIVIGVKQ